MGGLVPIWVPSWELRITKLTPLSSARGSPGGVVSYAEHSEASPSLGAANCLSPLPGAPLRPSGVTLYTDQEEASPPLRAANSKTIATFGGSWEAQRGGVALYTDQNEASPSLGAANCETDATFGGSWVAQRSGVIRKPDAGLAVTGGSELQN